MTDDIAYKAQAEQIADQFALELKHVILGMLDGWDGTVPNVVTATSICGVMAAMLNSTLTGMDGTFEAEAAAIRRKCITILETGGRTALNS